jgi:DNA-binding CsgD family transcriptional regulator
LAPVVDPSITGKDADAPCAKALSQTKAIATNYENALMAIVQIGGVLEIAPVLGIAETTVKTDLYRLFAKTDTSRQTDLIKLVAGYMSPPVGPLRS